MSTRFTPGSWTFELDDDGITDVKAVVFVKDNPGRAEIAQIEAQPQVEANAQLIAAAPDLYDALKALVARTEERDNPSDEGVSSCDPSMIAARAALAKAEGRSV